MIKPRYLHRGDQKMIMAAVEVDGFGYGSGNLELRGLFRSQVGDGRSWLWRFVNNPHLAPVVGKFFAAIQTNNIGSREGSSCAAARCRAGRNRKSKTSMPTTEESIEQPGNHT